MKLIKLVCSAATLMVSFGAMAAPFTYTWSTTSSGNSTGDFAGAAGRPVVISITLDNGGSTNVSQTWSPTTPPISVSFSLSGNVLSTIDVFSVGHALSANGSSFQSDAAGNLFRMPHSFNGTLTSQNAVTQGTDTDPVSSWSISQSNPIYQSDVNTNSISVLNHTQMNTPSNWQRAGIAPATSSSATAVPSMPLVAFGVLGLILSFFGSRFKSKSSV